MIMTGVSLTLLAVALIVVLLMIVSAGGDVCINLSTPNFFLDLFVFTVA
jgi:hypothetical protein